MGYIIDVVFVLYLVKSNVKKLELKAGNWLIHSYTVNVVFFRMSMNTFGGLLMVWGITTLYER